MARPGLLDVSWHERRPTGAGRPLRVNFEQELCRAPGPRIADASYVARNGRRRRSYRHADGRSQVQASLTDQVLVSFGC